MVSNIEEAVHDLDVLAIGVSDVLAVANVKQMVQIGTDLAKV